MRKPKKLHSAKPALSHSDDPNATNHRAKTGLRLLEAITALGKKQVEIAKEFSVSPSRFGHWVKGRHYPDPYFVFQFCQRYSVTADWIYRGVIFGLPASLAGDLSQQKPEFSEAQPEPGSLAPETIDT